MSEPLLSVRHLHKTFAGGGWWSRRRVRALHDVSFEVAAGEVVALVGESGSGKTTLARLIMRLEAPSAGEIWWRGQDVLKAEPRRPSAAYRAGVQMIFQDPFAALNPARRIGHHLERPLRLAGVAAGRPALAGKVEALLAAVGLQPAAPFARRFPHELSGGQRQRVCIARALAVDPALIVADEPTSMLDASLRGELLALLAALTRTRGRGMIYITHDLGAARFISDRVLVLSAGEIVEAGATASVLAAPSHPYTRALLQAAADPAGRAPRPEGASPS